jgi:hypothetical protein
MECAADAGTVKLALPSESVGAAVRALPLRHARPQRSHSTVSALSLQKSLRARSAERHTAPLHRVTMVVGRSTTMLRLGSSIRLTHAERARLQHLTDIEPDGIRSHADLLDYVAQCKAHYWGGSEDTRFLHWLIDQECARCLAN